MMCGRSKCDFGISDAMPVLMRALVLATCLAGVASWAPLGPLPSAQGGKSVGPLMALRGERGGGALSRRSVLLGGAALAPALVLGEAARADEPPVLSKGVTESGVMYEVLRETSAPGDKVGLVDKAEVGDVVIVKLLAKTADDGTVVMDTFKDGKGFAIPLGKKKVVQGLEDGIVGMKVGEVRRLFIPSGPLTDPLKKDLIVEVTFERRSKLMNFFVK